MPYYVYVIKSREGYRYIGMTGDMEARLRQHNGGESHSTKHGHEWRVIHLESYSNRAEAMRREKWLKSGVGREWLREHGGEWSPPLADSSLGS